LFSFFILGGDLEEEIDANEFTVNSNFRFEEKLGKMQNRYLWEIAGYFSGYHIVISHAETKAEYAYQSPDEETFLYLQNLKLNKIVEEKDKVS
jgi:hypothetical protein